MQLAYTATHYSMCTQFPAGGDIVAWELGRLTAAIKRAGVVGVSPLTRRTVLPEVVEAALALCAPGAAFAQTVYDADIPE